MSELPAFDPKAFATFAAQVGHHAALGLEYRGHGTDWVEMALPYADTLVGVEATGVIASGPIISLMDLATSMAVWLKLGRFQHQATLDLRVDYLRQATPGKTVVGRGECYAITRSIAFVRGVAHEGDAGDPVAHVAGTFMFTGRS